MKLTGNTILITGATSGIGEAFAEALLAKGNVVLVTGRREDKLAELQAKGFITRKCDVSVESERVELAKWAIESYPALNVIMNNAGVQYSFDLNDDLDIAKATAEINTNLTAPIHLSSLFIKHLKTVADPVIIQISSGLSFVPRVAYPVYCATKAALHSYTLSLRHQLKATPIKVFEIAPPAVDTNLGADHWSGKGATSHGGIPVSVFLAEAVQALEDDKLEAPIAMAKTLREKGEGAFEFINSLVLN